MNGRTVSSAPRSSLGPTVLLVLGACFSLGFFSLEAQVAGAQGVDLEPLGVLAGPVDTARVHDGHLFLSAGKTLTIYALASGSDEAAPWRVGSYTFEEEIWGFRVEGERAYVGANFFGLGILDISDPTEPRLLASHKTPSQTKIGSVSGARLAIIDHMEGVVVVDVSNEDDPVAVGSYFLDGYARDVVTAGSMAYAVDSPSGLYVFDLSRPGPPEPVGQLHAPDMPRSIEVAGGIAPGKVLLVGAGGGNLQIYDVSDASAPFRTSGFETPGNAHRVALAQHLAFVADGEEGLQVIDLSEPGQPKLAGAYKTGSPARDVTTDGEWLFVVVGDRGHGGDRRVEILRHR